jgi:uncharacterized protein (DUF433 family)
MNYVGDIFNYTNIHFDKSCDKNTRISVYDILVWLSERMTLE